MIRSVAKFAVKCLFILALVNFQVIPLAIMYTLMIATNNLCLKHVGVPFYYVGRSLTTVFNVVFSWILLRQATSSRCILCCAFIIFGFYLGVDQENLLGNITNKLTLLKESQVTTRGIKTTLKI